MILLLLLLALPCSAEFTPLPADTPESTNSNFKTLDEEIRRLDAIISSTASASASLAGDNKFTGSNEFIGPIKLSSSVAYTVPSSSDAWILNDSLTGGTNPGVCSSTVTYTVQGSSVGVYFAGAIENQTANGWMNIGVLVGNNDGNPSDYPVEYPKNSSITAGITPAGGYGVNMSFGPVPIVVAPGVHTFCIFAYQPDGTTAYWGKHTTSNGQSKPLWGVKEWR